MKEEEKNMQMPFPERFQSNISVRSKFPSDISNTK